MSDVFPAPSTTESARRGPRIGFILAIALLAFVIGLVAMAFAMRGPIGRWLLPAGTTQTATTATSTTAPQTPAMPSAPRSVPSSPDAATREAALAAQLTTLEARAAAISSDATTASGNAGRAEATLVTVAARRALDRGMPLGYLEEQLRVRFGAVQPRATMIVIQASRQPVTLQDLREGLDAIGPQLLASDSGGLIDFARAVRNLVVLHKEGTPSPLPADKLARARRLIDAGQAEAALAEVDRLPGAERAANWRAAARRYILARQAIDVLEGAALLGQAVPAPAPAPLQE